MSVIRRNGPLKKNPQNSSWVLFETESPNRSRDSLQHDGDCLRLISECDHTLTPTVRVLCMLLLFTLRHHHTELLHEGMVVVCDILFCEFSIRKMSYGESPYFNGLSSRRHFARTGICSCKSPATCKSILRIDRIIHNDLEVRISGSKPGDNLLRSVNAFNGWDKVYAPHKVWVDDPIQLFHVSGVPDFYIFIDDRFQFLRSIGWLATYEDKSRHE